MRKLLSIYFLLIISMGQAYPQDASYYKAATTPEILKEDADATIRYYKTSIEIEDVDYMVIKSHYIVTIWNEEGERMKNWFESYDSFSKVKSISGVMYDAYGKRIKRYNSSDVMDESAAAGYALYDDNRVKRISPSINKYPVTIEFFSEVETKGTFFIPSWYPQAYNKVSVQESIYEINSKIAFDVKTNQVEKGIENGYVTTWKVKDLPAVEYESMMPQSDDQLIFVRAKAKRFSRGGKEGSSESWVDFGNWVYGLNDEIKGGLSNKTKQTVSQLTVNLDTEYDKAKAIYEFMQSKTRYVLISEGLGGHQPIPASEVDKVGYGDCKALTNFTKELMQSAGIQAEYALIKAGRRKTQIDTEFPSSQFNHVILCLPNIQDTLWLECTSQTSPFGFLGDFTANRKALLIKKDASELVETASYLEDENRSIYKIDNKLTLEGDLEVSFNLQDHGEFFDMWDGLEDKEKKKQEERLLSFFDLPHTYFSDWNLKYHRNVLPVAEVSGNAMIRKYAQKVGENEILLPLNTLKEHSWVPPRYRNRKFPFEIGTAYSDEYTMSYEIPEGFEVSFVPDSVNIETEFGEYHITVEVKDDQLIYSRNIIIHKGVFEASKYNDYYKFRKQVAKNDQVKAVIKKRT